MNAGEVIKAVGRILSKVPWKKVPWKKAGEAVVGIGVVEELTRHGIKRLTKDDLNKRIKRLEEMLKKGRITEQEYKTLRKKLIEESSAEDI